MVGEHGMIIMYGERVCAHLVWVSGFLCSVKVRLERRVLRDLSLGKKFWVFKLLRRWADRFFFFLSCEEYLIYDAEDHTEMCHAGCRGENP